MDNARLKFLLALEEVHRGHPPRWVTGELKMWRAERARQRQIAARRYWREILSVSDPPAYYPHRLARRPFDHHDDGADRGQMKLSWRNHLIGQAP